MSNHPFSLPAAAYAEMLHYGFHPDFSPVTNSQLADIRDGEAAPCPGPCVDMLGTLWSSIDNDTSRDLDQIEMAEAVDGGILVRVAIADVSAKVSKDSPIDRHAADQTLTIYTAVRNFPMLPFELSTDLTSLNVDQDRAAVVVEYLVGADGEVTQEKIYRARVRNRAQLAYSKVGPFLEGSADAVVHPAPIPGLEDQLRLQDQAARALRDARVRAGALEFHRVEADPVVFDGKVQAIKSAVHNRAMKLIEEFMIGANETMARTLKAGKRSCIRRVVKSPERWERIVALAAEYGTKLPDQPDSASLNQFLQKRREADPLRYPDLSVAIIKLMGPGEYVLVSGKDETPPGHFGLAALDYTHSTAPNRRFADLVTQRVVKALLDGMPPPYSDEELARIAQHCSERESAARKVERKMQKRVAAVALAHSIGKSFHGVITGANDKGVFVRIFDPPVEGRIVEGERGADVGDIVDVVLLRTDPERAFIDFGKR
jgi:exoribonuclease-2